MDVLKLNQTAHPLLFLLIQSADHVSPLTGLGSSVTVTLSKNGGAFAAAAGAITEIANGWYTLAGNATDENTLGPLKLHATGTGSDPADKEFQVVAFDPDNAASLGLTGLSAMTATNNVLTAAATNALTATGTILMNGSLNTKMSFTVLPLADAHLYFEIWGQTDSTSAMIKLVDGATAAYEVVTPPQQYPVPPGSLPEVFSLTVPGPMYAYEFKFRHDARDNVARTATARVLI